MNRLTGYQRRIRDRLRSPNLASHEPRLIEAMRSCRNSSIL